MKNKTEQLIASLISSFHLVCKLIISMSDIVLLRTSSACVNFLDRIQNVESRQKPAWLLDFSCGSTAKYFSDCNVVRPVGYGRCRRSGDILVVNCGMLVGLILSITYIIGGLLTSIMQVQKRGH